MRWTEPPGFGRSDISFRNGMVFTPAAGGYRLPPKERAWQARWIWAPATLYPQYQTCPYTNFKADPDNFSVFFFQKRWRLDQCPKEAMLYLTADTSYKAYLNGYPVGRGCAQPGGDYSNCDSIPYKFYEAYDVAARLRTGENILTVQVCLGAVVQSEISCGHGGLLLELDADGSIAVQSDTSWKCARDDRHRTALEWNSADCATPAERGGGLDDTGWAQAETVADQAAFPRLYATPIPNLVYHQVYPAGVLMPFSPERITVSEDRRAIRLSKGAPLTFWLDFGSIYAAFFYLHANGADNVKITLHMQEFPGKVERKGTTETLFLRQGENRRESLRLQSIRYVQVTVSNLWQDIEVTDVGINVSAYPVEEKGRFTCSNPLYEDIYHIGQRTNQICRQTYHMDSPIHQEPLGCMGDYVIESLMNYTTFGDYYLTRFDILKIALYMKSRDYVMFHPSYCLLYIGMIRDYVLYSGDMAILEDVAPAIHGILTLFLGYLGENGLIEKAPNYMFMDWIREGPFNRHHPPKCMGQGYMTAMLVGALDNAAALLEMAREDSAGINHYREQRAKIAESIRQHLWDAEKGLFWDGLYDPAATESTRWMPADVDQPFYSQHMNTLAVLYGIVPEAERAILMERVMTTPGIAQAQPYFLHFVLNALDVAGLFEKYGLATIARWKDLMDENPDSLKEVWHGFDCDYSHAWGGTPTFQLPDKILGVRPAEPGFSKALFRPCLPTELDFAEGSIPTPHGPIHVRLDRVNGTLSSRIDAPEAVEII